MLASAAIGGAAASFGSDFLGSHSEIIAFLAVLFATLLLAMKEREARRSQIGQQLGQLFAEERKALPAPGARETQSTTLLLAAASAHRKERS